MCAHNHKKKGRRNFLKQLACTGMGVTAMLSGMTSLNLLNAAAGMKMSPFVPFNDYKALVCISLSGGNDSFNMLTPTDQEAYDAYADARSNLALIQEDLLPINTPNISGANYGLHPNLSNLQQLFNDGKAAFVANVGTLLQPTTLEDYHSGSYLPLGLYSHNDQSNTWQTSIPQERSGVGWGGRLADIVNSQNANSNISMNISLSGVNVFQSGVNVTEYTIASYTDGGILLNGSTSNSFEETLKRATLDNLMDQSYQSILKQAYGNRVTNSRAHALEFNAALASTPALQTEFPQSYMGFTRDLGMVARTIAAREALGFSRQVFYVDFGGFDNHSLFLESHASLMAELDIALKTFYEAMEELGLADKVCTFTISDFGRTLRSNGEGSDHGWGANCLVLGGAVQGGHIYGEYPELALGNSLDVGQGRLIPTTSCDEYFAELASWFASDGFTNLSVSDMIDILPNIESFWSPIEGQGPLGFLS